MRSAPNNPQLSAMWLVDPDRAVRMVREALKKHGGNREKAAKELRISVRVLYRYLDKYPKSRDRKRKPRLTSAAVARVHELRKSGKTLLAIAKELHVSESYICLVVNGRRKGAST
jgi:hypothetical protein